MPSAPLQPLVLVGPGFGGLNKQQSSSILGVPWAAEAQNCVFDSANRLASRNGWTALNATPMSGSPSVGQVFEYKPLTGTNAVVSTGGNKLYTGVATLTNQTGAVTVTADNWKFVNFNGNVYGLQTGHALIQYTGTGTFTVLAPASGTVPNGNELCAAFGRLWGVASDKNTLKYCNLLDSTNWTGAGAGSFNFTSVWPSGADEIVAVQAFNNRLVIFGKRNILFLADPTTGSALGLNPTNAIVVDAIGGIGCIERDSVQNIDGNDIVFLSNSGIQSLNRIIQERSNPLRDVSKNVRDYLMGLYTASSAGTVRSAYSPRNGLYLVSFPGAMRIMAFDTRQILQDGSWRATEWTSFIPSALATLEDGVTLYCGKAGQLFAYGNYLDNGASYRFVYQSGWLDFGQDVQNYLKILKRIRSVVFFQGVANILFKFAFDFDPNFHTFNRSTTFTPGGMEWGVGEWGLGEWGGSFGLQTLTMPGSGSGQFIKIGVELDISGSQIAIQQLEVYAKAGRLA